MSSLRDRIEGRGGRKRKQAKVVNYAEDDEDRDSEEVSEGADNGVSGGSPAAEDDAETEEPKDDGDADEDFDVADKKRKAASKSKPKAAPKAAPKRKPKPKPEVMSEEEEDSEPSSSEDAVESDHKDDEDYIEKSDAEEEESEEDDDSEFDDDDVVDSKRRRSTRAPARIQQSTRKPPAKKKSAAASRPAGRRKSPPKTRRSPARKKVDSSSDEQEADDDSDFGAPPRARRPRTSVAAAKRKSPRSVRRQRTCYKDVGSSGEEDQEDHDSDEVLEETPPNKPSARTASSSKRTPSRASAARATRKMAELKKKQQQPLGSDDDEVEEEEEEEEVARSTRKRKKVDSDDEDYEDGKQEEEEEEEEEIGDDELDEDDDLGVARVAKKTRSKPTRRRVHDDDEVDKDDNSLDDDDLGVARAARHTRTSTASRVQEDVADTQSFCDDDISEVGSDENLSTPNVARRRIHDDAEKEEESRQRRCYKKKYVDAGSDEENYDSENDAGEIVPTPKMKEKTKSRGGGPKCHSNLQICPSDVDAITDVPLPSRHVCFISPDGSSRQCFTLETLHKIATTTAHPQYRSNLGQQQLTFLQPPHFRSAMSDDLVDQIASRFGREALILNGPFYNRSKAPLQGSNVDDLYQVHFGGVLADDEAFCRKKRDFALNIMGSRDIYPCPVCYTVAHHELVGGEEDSDDGDNRGPRPIPLELKRDPMSVLGNPDDEDFEVAAAFCFTSMAHVKRHLREEHQVDTSRVDNKDLYAKFKVRTQDGLLQRYLSQSGVYGDRKQGDMRRYWYDGNSELFIYLLDRMEYMNDCKSLLGDKIRNPNNSDSDDSDDRAMTKAKETWAKAKSFFRSFADQAEDLWERISGPYTKATKQDMEDFIADDEDEEETDDVVRGHQVFDREKAMAEMREEKALAQYYEQRAESGEDSASDHEEKKGAGDSVGGDDECHGPHLSSPSEDDDWVQNIRSKKRKSSLGGGAKKNGKSRRQSFKKIGEKRYESASEESADPDYDDPMSLPSSTPITKRKAVFEDSDDD